MIKVVIVDDQDIIREGLKMLLSREQDLEICGVGINGQEAIDLCKWYHPDVVLMDIKMPILDGIQATKEIKKINPDIKIILLTTFKDDEFIHDALAYGASGYLLKDSTPQKIADAIRTVKQGGALLDPDVATRVIKQFTQLKQGITLPDQDERLQLLTDREKEIASYVGRGKNNKEIAAELYIGEGTVKNHITKILEKLELRDRTQLAIFAVKNDLV